MELTSDISLIWLVYGVAILIALVIEATGVYKWHSPMIREPAIGLVCFISLTCLLATVLLLPVDIAIISSTTDHAFGVKKKWATSEKIANIEKTMQTVYYVLYGLDALLCLLIIPFTYFWWEEDLDSDEAEDDNNLGATAPSRLLTSLKYTFGFVSILAVFLCFGFFLPVSEIKNTLIGKTPASSLDRFVTFSLASFLSIGTLLYTLYTSVGLAYIPFNLFSNASVHSVPVVASDVRSRLERNRERQRQLCQQSPTLSTHRTRREMEYLAREERSLVRQKRLAQETRSYCTCTQHGGPCLFIWKLPSVVLIPVKNICGGVLLVLSGLLWVSMFVTSIDSAMSSLGCKDKCNYLIGMVHNFQPFNALFVWTSRFFLLDHVLLVLLIAFLFASSITGISIVGIRFLWVRIFSVKPGRTLPQALLLATEMLALMVLAINYAIVGIIAPQYSLYGSQTVCTASVTNLLGCHGQPELVVPCGSVHNTSLFDHKYSHVCTPSVMSTFVNRIIVSWPLFGAVTFWAQFAFLSVYIGALVLRLLRGRNSRSVNTELDDEWPDSEEERLLAGGPLHGRKKKNTYNDYGTTWRDVVRRNRARTSSTDDDEEAGPSMPRRAGISASDSGVHRNNGL